MLACGTMRARRIIIVFLLCVVIAHIELAGGRGYLKRESEGAVYDGEDAGNGEVSEENVTGNLSMISHETRGSVEISAGKIPTSMILVSYPEDNDGDGIADIGYVKGAYESGGIFTVITTSLVADISSRGN